MIRYDLRAAGRGAVTGLAALALVLCWLGWPVWRRGPVRATRSLANGQIRRDAALLGEPELCSGSLGQLICWLACQAVLGPLTLAVTACVGGLSVLAVTTPLWWWLVPPAGTPIVFVPVTSMASAFLAALFGLVLVFVAIGLCHGLPRAHARFNRVLFGDNRKADLKRRVAALTESRTGAMESQTAELRRIERDLHDGAQAKLVSVRMLLGLLDTRLADVPGETRQLLDEARTTAREALQELRDLVRGVYPPILTDRGLAGAIDSLAGCGGAEVAVTVDVGARLPAPLESTAYFVVSEALANIAKHSGADHAEVMVLSRDGVLTIDVSDNGRGGADERQGSGLAGLRRRVAAFDGTMSLLSDVGGPTALHVEIPCAS